jgi:MFS family permease
MFSRLDRSLPTDGTAEPARPDGRRRRVGSETDGTAEPARPDGRRRRVGALGRRTFASLRKHRNYRLYFAGQIVSVSGNWMQNVGLAWFVIDLTRSPLAVGVLAFCRFLPFTVFGLVGGVLADRFDNRRLFAVTQLGSLTVSVALAVLAFSGDAKLWQVYALAALGGTAMVLDGPGRHALTFQLVGRDELSNAVALNASLFNMSRVVGPALAGALIAVVGLPWCFAVNAMSFLAVFVALALMRREELFPIARGARPPTLVRGVREAFGYVAGASDVRTVLLLTAGLSAVGFNFHVLVPMIAADEASIGPGTFGLLAAAFGGGAFVGALLSATIARASWTTILVATVGFSLSVLALASQAATGPAAFFLFMTGAFFTLESSNGQSILQLSAPDHLRGRVLSLYLLSFGGLAPVGGLIAGWLAERGGVQLAFGVAGSTGLVCAAMILASRTLGHKLVTE